jgi:hypothetical protein
MGFSTEEHKAIFTYLRGLSRETAYNFYRLTASKRPNPTSAKNSKKQKNHPGIFPVDKWGNATLRQSKSGGRANPRVKARVNPRVKDGRPYPIVFERVRRKFARPRLTPAKSLSRWEPVGRSSGRCPQWGQRGTVHRIGQMVRHVVHVVVRHVVRDVVRFVAKPLFFFNLSFGALG